MKRIFAILIIFCLCFGLMATPAFAKHKHHKYKHYHHGHYRPAHYGYVVKPYRPYKLYSPYYYPGYVARPVVYPQPYYLYPASPWFNLNIKL